MAALSLEHFAQHFAAECAFDCDEKTRSLALLTQ